MRKQVYDLTADDLDAHPVWEHCLDEEGTPGQDEATVRPFDAGGKPLEYEGLLVVRATLTLANGTRLPGYVYYAPELPPAAGQLADAYRKLGADAKGAFPVRYASEVPLATGPISGEIAGFQYIVSRRKGWFSSERVVETVS